MWVTSLTDPDGYRLGFESLTDTPEDTKLSEVEALSADESGINQIENCCARQIHVRSWFDNMRREIAIGVTSWRISRLSMLFAVRWTPRTRIGRPRHIPKAITDLGRTDGEHLVDKVNSMATRQYLRSIARKRSDGHRDSATIRSSVPSS